MPISFYAEDFLYSTRPWGLLEIGAAVLAAAAGHLPEPPVYTLIFEARATYWYYQLSARCPPLRPGLHIGNDSAVKFSPAPPLPGAEASFRADQPIKYAQRYALAPYKLSGPAGPLPRAAPVLLAELAQASPASLRPVATENTPVYILDIFVQV